MLYEVTFFKGFHGLQDSEIVEAVDREWAELIFEQHFPKKVKYIIEIKEFHHNVSWMKPLEEMKIYRNSHPKLEQIDWSKLTIGDIETVISKAVGDSL